MATNATAIEYSNRVVRHWHPGGRVVIAVVLAVLSWTPILIVGVFFRG